MNVSALKVLSEVSRDIAQVFFASAVATQIFNVEAVIASIITYKVTRK